LGVALATTPPNAMPLPHSANDLSNEKVLGILHTTDELNRLRDVDAILDKILLEARRLTGADAGSIFLVEEQHLRFAYVQNDTLFSADASNANAYADFSVPINEKSIVGYTALTGEQLAVSDAYDLPPDVPFAFNPEFDRRSGYRTQSILNLPIRTFENKLVGVVQLINAQADNGGTVAFAEDAKAYAQLLANSAALTIERGMLNRELILRMVQTAELRDPEETGAHVQRVGAYSAEILRTWAVARKWDAKAIRTGMDTIRLAAMLHDVGKVGVPDAIMKKPGVLTDDERAIMKWHTVYGARLFLHTHSELDRMSRDIALNHHERWSGGGYPGRITNLMASEVTLGAGRQGEDIPIAARIVALADVFDALSSPRCYKEPWSDEKVLALLASESGGHFDPDVVEAFFSIFDVIKAIRSKYRDEAVHAATAAGPDNPAADICRSGTL